MGVFLSTGLQLHSSRSTDEAFDILEGRLERDQPRSHPELPHVVPCGHRWNGGGPEPERVVCFTADGDEFVVVAAWPLDDGCELGLFVLGAAGADRHVPIVTTWQLADRSLTITGSFPPKSISLTEPPVPADYVEEIVRTAGFATTRANIAAMGEWVIELHLIKAQEYINSQSRQQAARFVADHRGPTDPQTVLRDLGNWNSSVIPHIQDLPVRIRAMLVEPGTHDVVAERLPES
jgi:hypothetical protein